MSLLHATIYLAYINRPATHSLQAQQQAHTSAEANALLSVDPAPIEDKQQATRRSKRKASKQHVDTGFLSTYSSGTCHDKPHCRLAST